MTKHNDTDTTAHFTQQENDLTWIEGHDGTLAVYHNGLSYDIARPGVFPWLAWVTVSANHQSFNGALEHARQIMKGT